jgi:hypothetical protein
MMTNRASDSGAGLSSMSMRRPSRSQGHCCLEGPGVCYFPACIPSLLIPGPCGACRVLDAAERGVENSCPLNTCPFCRHGALRIMVGTTQETMSTRVIRHVQHAAVPPAMTPARSRTVQGPGEGHGWTPRKMYFKIPIREQHHSITTPALYLPSRSWQYYDTMDSTKIPVTAGMNRVLFAARLIFDCTLRSVLC